MARVYLAFAGVAAMLGMSFLLSGERRTSSSAYELVRATGGYDVWGIAFLCGAIVIIIVGMCCARCLFVVLLIGAVGYLVLAILFAMAASRHPDANYTAIAAYTGIAIFHVLGASRVNELLHRQRLL